LAGAFFAAFFATFLAGAFFLGAAFFAAVFFFAMMREYVREVWAHLTYDNGSAEFPVDGGYVCED
ncbi:hypothetical protein N9105_06465, partial [Akkermansiaceae bacterium]|nr:hypothetical protein [Akkermansiaceae bacterium]